MWKVVERMSRFLRPRRPPGADLLGTARAQSHAARAEARDAGARAEAALPDIEAMSSYLEQRGGINGFTASLRAGAQRRLAGE